MPGIRRMILLLTLAAAASVLLILQSAGAAGSADQAPITSGQPGASQASERAKRFKISRYEIPYGKHRQAKHDDSPSPASGTTYSLIAPLPGSGHDYLKGLYSNH